MRNKVLKTIREHAMARPGERVLLAFSGGPDSVAMLHLFTRIAPVLDVTFLAAHVNHGIRGEDALLDEAFARDFAARFSVPFFSTRIDVPAEAGKSGEGMEESARRLRYAFLEETARSFGCTRIATAHTRDDSVESILLHIARGCGVQGLFGIPAVRGNIIRPFIDVTKDEILAYLDKNRLPFATDATNDDVAYARNRVRHRVLPELRELNPAVADAVLRLSEIAKLDADCLDGMADELLRAALRDETPPGLSVPLLKNAHPAVAHRVLRKGFRHVAGGELSDAQTRAVYSLLKNASPSARIRLKSGFEVVKKYDILVLEKDRAGPHAPPAPAPLIPDERTVYHTVSVHATPVDAAGKQGPGLYYMKRELETRPLVVRPRRAGDRIELHGKPGSRALSRLFIDEKIPKDERDFLPVIAAGDEVIAVYPLGPSARHTAKPGEPALKITVAER